MSAVPEPILKPGQTQQKKRKQAEVTATASGSGSAADTADTAAADATPAPAPAPAPQTDAADAAIAKRSRVEESNSEAADAAAKAADAAAVEPPQHEHMYAMVCRSNMNRSMANHDILERHGFKVCSYGIGREVKVPSRDKKGRMFPFGTPYKDILEALTKEDEKFNIASGVIPMLKRNKEIKEAPEDFRKIPDEFLRSVDVVICSEHDIFERVVEGECRTRFCTLLNTHTLTHTHSHTHTHTQNTHTQAHEHVAASRAGRGGR